MTGLAAWATSAACLICTWPLLLTAARGAWLEQAGMDLAEARGWLGC